MDELTEAEEWLLQLIAEAVHEDCGGPNCGAEDMHMDTAICVFSTLKSKGLIDVTVMEAAVAV